VLRPNLSPDLTLPDPGRAPVANYEDAAEAKLRRMIETATATHALGDRLTITEERHRSTRSPRG